jgi:hypothetical protein
MWKNVEENEQKNETEKISHRNGYYEFEFGIAKPNGDKGRPH